MSYFAVTREAGEIGNIGEMRDQNGVAAEP